MTSPTSVGEFMTKINDMNASAIDAIPEMKTLVLQPKWRITYAATKGETPPEMLALAERTLHQVPKVVGGNHFIKD